MVEDLDGGAGNKGGSGKVYGNNGTGGLLIIYSENVINKYTIASNGSNGGYAETGGGSSGGGSINIFYKDKISLLKEIAIGGYATGKTRVGGAGGNGTVTIGNIGTGTFVKDE